MPLALPAPGPVGPAGSDGADGATGPTGPAGAGGAQFGVFEYVITGAIAEGTKVALPAPAKDMSGNGTKVAAAVSSAFRSAAGVRANPITDLGTIVCPGHALATNANGDFVFEALNDFSGFTLIVTYVLAEA